MKMRKPAVVLKGYDPASMFPLHATAVDAVVDAIFGKIGFPEIKSDTITIRNEVDSPTPVYVANGEEELIIVTSEGNYPYQFIYQLAHELGHLSARGDLRYPRTDGLLWIEEALCEAHSLIALQRIANAVNDLSNGSKSYLLSLLEQETLYLGLSPQFFSNNLEELTASAGSTEASRVFARHLYYRVPHDNILSDNRSLMSTPVGLGCVEFLTAWKAHCGEESVPALLMQELAA